MYKVKETESALEVRSKTAMGFVWTGLFLIILVLSFYMSFEYISINIERPLVQSNEQKANSSKIPCFITYFNFKEGIKEDTVFLSQILRMDKGYSSSTNEASFVFHYNPTIVTLKREYYPLRRISDVTFTKEEEISSKFNTFIESKNKLLSLNTWDWYMGYWGIAAGISFLGLLFLSVSGRYQVVCFDKKSQKFSIKNYGLLGFVGEEGNWKDIKRIIYQDKKTRHKKGIFFLVRRKISPSSKKFKTKKIYFTHHTDTKSKEVAKRIADLVRPIAKPNAEKNKSVNQGV